MTTRPRSDIAACGTYQLRLTCATKRRSHGPNSTPFESNWMSGVLVGLAALLIVEVLVLQELLQVAQLACPDCRRPAAPRTRRGSRGRRDALSGIGWRRRRAPAAPAVLRAGRLLVRRADHLLGRVAARERHRVLGLRRRLGRGGAAVQIRLLGLRLRRAPCISTRGIMWTNCTVLVRRRRHDRDRSPASVGGITSQAMTQQRVDQERQQDAFADAKSPTVTRGVSGR